MGKITVQGGVYFISEKHWTILIKHQKWAMQFGFIAKDTRHGNSAQHLPMLAHCKHSLNLLTFQFISLSWTRQTHWNGFAIHAVTHATFACIDACVQNHLNFEDKFNPGGVSHVLFSDLSSGEVCQWPSSISLVSEEDTKYPYLIVINLDSPQVVWLAGNLEFRRLLGKHLHRQTHQEILFMSVLSMAFAFSDNVSIEVFVAV